MSTAPMFRPHLESPSTSTATLVTSPPAAPPQARDTRFRRLLSRIRAWMVVPFVDAVATLVPALWRPDFLVELLFLAAAVVTISNVHGRFRARLHLSVLDEIPGILSKLLVATALVAGGVAVAGGSTRGFLFTALFSVAIVLAGRVLTTSLVLWGRRSGITEHPTILIGSGALTEQVASVLNRDRRYGLRVVGSVDDVLDGADQPCWLGGLDRLDGLVEEHKVTVILVVRGAFKEVGLLDLVRTDTVAHCDLLVVPRLHEFHTQAGLVDHIDAIPVMRIRNPSLRGPSAAIKRGFDILAGGLAILVLSPLFVACALAVRLEGGPGVIFRQQRVGRDGQPFECLKFRSMRPATDEESATRWNVRHDDRVGPVGRVLRKTSLDELPQLFNIFRGDMTLVGPRPERPHFVSKFETEHPRYVHRHRVRSGLTGLAQVSGLRGDTSIAARSRYDNYYIENWSLWLDVKILARTVREVLMARGDR